jgi:hypothetical protein
MSKFHQRIQELQDKIRQIEQAPLPGDEIRAGIEETVRADILRLEEAIDRASDVAVLDPSKGVLTLTESAGGDVYHIAVWARSTVQSLLFEKLQPEIISKALAKAGALGEPVSAAKKPGLIHDLKCKIYALELEEAEAAHAEKSVLRDGINPAAALLIPLFEAEEYGLI